MLDSASPDTAHREPRTEYSDIRPIALTSDAVQSSVCV